MALDFDDEVRIATADDADAAARELRPIAGRLGVVVGKSTGDDGTVTAYAVDVDGSVVWMVEPENLVATGVRRDTTASMSGVSIRVSERGEILDG